MAKRARGTHSRPGQRARLQRRTPLTPRLSSPVGPPTVSITPEEEARAAEEYGYVSRDVRRIILIGGSLVTFLVGLWAVIQVTGTRLF